MLIAALTALSLLSCSGERPLSGDSGTGTSFPPSAAGPLSPVDGLFRQKIDALEAELFDPDGYRYANRIHYDPSQYGYTVFLSLCDATQRAAVCSGTGPGLDEAWNLAVERSRQFAEEQEYQTLWLKADIVSGVETGPAAGIAADVRPGFFREGIATDRSFSTALLEAELNGGGMIDYDTGELDLAAINDHLRQSGRDVLPSLPETLLRFTTTGFFCGEDNVVHRLEDEGYAYGRRITAADRAQVEQLVHSASNYLLEQVTDDGSFVYGYYPVTDTVVEGYNIMRHTGTLWSLILQYRSTRDEAYLPAINAATGYLVEKNIEFPEEGIAYVIDRNAGEAKLGANALAILALIEYMEGLEEDRYAALVNQLAEGMLRLMDRETGSYYHVLSYPDFRRKAEFRTVYYDGEATFALAKLYGFSGNQDYLDAAKAALERFIREDYTQHTDHWVSYAVNEVTKHIPDPRYFAFGLRNAGENLHQIYWRDTTSHTYLELLMAAFELYDRAVEQDIPLDRTAFNEYDLIDTIFYRADHMLNGYFFPELAMYTERPDRIADSFFIRHDAFRVRIDDVQHFLGGYRSFAEHYDKLAAYRDILTYKSESTDQQ